MPLAVASAVKVPFLRPKQNGWEFVWQRYLVEAEKWRRELSKTYSIRFREELHGYKIFKHQGLYHRTWRNLSPTEAKALYEGALSSLRWLPDRSIMTTYAGSDSNLMGHEGNCRLSVQFVSADA